jgi:hypothetical protein
MSEMDRVEQIRIDVMSQLGALGYRAATSAHIHKVLSYFNGDDYRLTEVSDALFFLVGQELAEKIRNAVSGAFEYRITSRGIMHLEGEV